MLILLDQGTPAPLRYSMEGHQIRTVHEQGWDNLSDYELLEAACQANFEVFITPDKNLSSHHDLSQHKLAVVVLNKSRWKLVRLVLGDIEAALISARPGRYVAIDVPELPETWD
jgi:predicted nuclease of predicted toxin-antitoxin system